MKNFLIGKFKWRLIGLIVIVAGITLLVFSLGADFLGLGLPGSGIGYKQGITASISIIFILSGFFIHHIFKETRSQVNPLWKYTSLLMITGILLSGTVLVIYPSEIGEQLVMLRSKLGIDPPLNTTSLTELLTFIEDRSQKTWLENQQRFNLDQPTNANEARELIDAIVEANRNSNNSNVIQGINQKVSNLQEQLIDEVNGARRYRVQFKNDLGLTINGILSVPLSDGPHPLIIIPNGITSTPDNLFLIDREDYQHGAACKFEGDYVVFALQIPSSTEYSNDLDFLNKMNWAAIAAGLNYRYYLTTDRVISALDYLESRPEIDPSRVAIYGISMGGDAAIGGGLNDTRIKVIATSGTNVIEPLYDDLFSKSKYSNPYKYRYNILSLPDDGTALLAVFPRKIIVELNQQDTTGSFDASLHRAQQIKRIYSLLGIDENAIVITFNHAPSDIAPQGHEMEVAQVKRQIDQWFDIQPSAVVECKTH